jgi:hypothetical protein
MFQPLKDYLRKIYLMYSNSKVKHVFTGMNKIKPTSIFLKNYLTVVLAGCYKYLQRVIINIKRPILNLLDISLVSKSLQRRYRCYI